MDSLNGKKIKLAMFSSGLGTINRGFEISTARFFKAISQSNQLDTRLFAGSNYPDASRVWCIGRDQWLRWPLKPFSFMERERLWKLAYILEQSSYGFGLIKESKAEWQPNVVWTKEVPLAHILYEFRRISGNPYKIIFSNGGGFKPSTYQQFDFIQHLHPEAYEEAIRFGIPAEKMTVLPNVVPEMVSGKSKEELRAEFGYKQDDWIIICVSAWNSHHKRIDYLIEEVAGLDNPNCHLLICGQPEPEGEKLQALAKQKLGDRVRFVTVPETEVHKLLKMSDLFVLCSLYEGLGAVIIEAALSGLPVICHPHGGSRYILQDDAWLLDMSQHGSLTQRLQRLRDNPVSPEQLQKLKTSVQSRFSEKKIASNFEAMVEYVAGTKNLTDKGFLVSGS